jgi:hypothetical protein
VHDHSPLALAATAHTDHHHRKYVRTLSFFLPLSPIEPFHPFPIRSMYNVNLPHTSQSPPQPPPLSRMTMFRKARGKVNKPAGLFIHPNNSNLARADAVAVELGLHRSTERVEALRTSCDSDDDDAMAAWGQGRGRDAARNLLTRSATHHHQQTRSHSRSESQRNLFQVGDSESESDG